MRHIVLLVALHLPWLRDIKAHFRTHEAQGWRYAQTREGAQTHPALEVSHTFLNCLSPTFELANVIDISTDSCNLTFHYLG